MGAYCRLALQTITELLLPLFIGIFNLAVSPIPGFLVLPMLPSAHLPLFWIFASSDRPAKLIAVGALASGSAVLSVSKLLS